MEGRKNVADVVVAVVVVAVVAMTS